MSVAEFLIEEQTSDVVVFSLSYGLRTYHDFLLIKTQSLASVNRQIIAFLESHGCDRRLCTVISHYFKDFFSKNFLQ